MANDNTAVYGSYLGSAMVSIPNRPVDPVTAARRSAKLAPSPAPNSDDQSTIDAAKALLAKAALLLSAVDAADSEAISTVEKNLPTKEQ